VCSRISHDEKIEDLQCDGLKIIVRDDGFRYGTDSILLANFAKARKGRDIVELCSGTGAVSILLSAKTRAPKIVGIEIREQLADMANRSAAMNNIADRVRFIAGDIREIRKHMKAGAAGAVVANPPYFRMESGTFGTDEGAAEARHEIKCDLSDVAGAAKWLLNQGGLFYIVHRPDRLADLFAAMRASGIEPKTLQPAGRSTAAPPPIVLVLGIKGAAPGLRYMRQLII
jgi:tRNA1(Val) A37 N6-methylase TrmN6